MKNIILFIILATHTFHAYAGLIDEKITKSATIKYDNYKKIKTFPYPLASFDRNIPPALKWNLKDIVVTPLIQKSTIPLLAIHFSKAQNNIYIVNAFWANGNHVNGEITIKDKTNIDKNLYRKIMATCDFDTEDDCF